jgi:hypothetical protein
MAAERTEQQKASARYGLYCFLLMICIVAFGLYVAARQKAAWQNEAVSVIAQTAGRVTSDSVTPPWLAMLVGDDLFLHVIGVDTRGDDGLAVIDRWADLKSLRLDTPHDTDAWLGRLKNFANLAKLRILNAKITAAGLTRLKALTQLQELDLYDTNVTDADEQELRKSLPNCKIRRGSIPWHGPPNLPANRGA